VLTSPTSSSLTSTSPRPPARPWERPRVQEYGMSRYDDNSYGSSYGSYGRDYLSRDRYGSSYGAVGNSYGGVGNSYGGYGGSSYGGYGRERDYVGFGGYGSNYSGYNGGYGRIGPYQDGKPGGFLANGFSWMHSLQYVVDTFSRFSRLLDANYDAMHGSFTSVVRLCERMGQLNSEVMMMIKTFTLFRILQSFSTRFMQVFRYITGRPMALQHTKESKLDFPRGKGGFNVRDFKEFTRADQPLAPGWGSMMVVFIVTFVGLPVLLHRLVTVFTRSRHRDSMELQWGQLGGQERVRAKYDFVAETNRDLSFCTGDVLVVLNKAHPDWWEAEINGRAGLIPSNYIEPIEHISQDTTNNKENNTNRHGEVLPDQ